MSIPVPSLFVRRWFARAFNNGELLDYPSLDVQHADLVEGHNLVVQRLNLISTANGTLVTLESTTSFTATASQTAFTVPSYDTTSATVHAYTNSGSGNLTRLAQASVTKSSATVVTLPAQAVGATVIIDVYGPGNGTTALASTSVGQGASLVGINDTGGLLTATNVETALQEIATNLASASYLGGVLTITAYTKKDGSVAFTGDQSMGSHKLTNLAAGTASSNDAARMADITGAALQTALSAYLAATYLALSGGTMSGNIAMGGNKVTGLGAATINGDAVRYNEFQAINGSQITAGTVAAARLAVLVGDTGAGGTQGAVPAPAAGDAAAQKYLAASGLWAAVPSNLGGYILLVDQKANNTSGGSSGALAWTTRDLNTEVVDTQNACTLSANQFTLIAGTYRIEISSPFYRSDRVQTRLRNITDGSTTINGSSMFCDNAALAGQVTTVSRISGRFTIASSKAFALQYWCGTAFATYGLGVETNSGEVETYSIISIIKE